MKINEELINYLTKEILPEYSQFDAGHRQPHIEYVMNRSKNMAEFFHVDVNMSVTAAAYHDIGMKVDRKTHAIESAKIIKKDMALRKWFSEEQIDIMAHAIEQHSASYGEVPDTIYAKILSQADRNLNFESIVNRSFQYGQKNYAKHSFLDQVERVFQYVIKKYGKNGYVKLWLDFSEDEQKLSQIKKILELNNVKDIIENICKEAYLSV